MYCQAKHDCIAHWGRVKERCDMNWTEAMNVFNQRVDETVWEVQEGMGRAVSEELDERMSALQDGVLQGQENRLAGLEGLVQSLGAKVEELENTVVALKSKVAGLKHTRSGGVKKAVARRLQPFRHAKRSTV
jgi:hypothetical protein